MAPPDSPRRVLVTGASGFVGGRACARLLQQGWEVHALARADWTGAPEVPAAQRHFGSLPDAIPPRCVEGMDAIVHCAAQTAPATDELTEAVNVRGTASLARLAAAAGVPRFVFLSTQAARPDAPAAYGRTKHAAELALAGVAGLDTWVLRPGLVVGPGAAGLFGRMRRVVDRLPVVPLLGGGRALVQPIHVDDLAAAIERCAAGLAPPGLYRLGDPAGLTLRELLLRSRAGAGGRSKPALPVPLAPLLLATRLAEALGLRLPVTASNLRGLRAVERMETAADLARLGLKLRPLDEALA